MSGLACMGRPADPKTEPSTPHRQEAPTPMPRPAYVTKDSGARAQFDSGMQRDTEAGKPRFDLLIPVDVPYEEQFLTRLAGLMGRGAEKYDDRNWEQANSEKELARMKSSAFRHFMQWLCGETDEDHAAATAFNLLAFETTKRKVEQEPRLASVAELHAKWVTYDEPGPLDCIVTVTGDTGEAGHGFDIGTVVRVVDASPRDGLLRCGDIDRASDYWWVCEVDLA